MNQRQQRILDFLDASGARLHVLLTRLTMSEDTATDLLQELFLRLLKSGGFEKAEDPYAYAYRAAINLAFEHRRNSKLKSVSLSDENIPGNKASDPTEKIIQAEEVRQLLEALARMKSLEREVIIRRFLEQESYEQIAMRIGKKESHLRSFCSKAMAKLRGLLTKENQ